MTINEKLIKYNFNKNPNRKIEYIVIHDTGNTGVGASADNHFKYFDGADRQASAHYFVDDKQILRVVRDEDVSWHCGDGHGKYGITNNNSIGIEMCINKDGDFDKTRKNTIDLVKYLMDKYNIPESKVVRHYDASRKLCPNKWLPNNWEEWHKFKYNLMNDANYTDIITAVYEDMLDREPDEEGLNYWSSKVSNHETLGKFLIEILGSDEYKSKHN